MPRHNLPSGGWVEFRDGAMLRAKDQKKILQVSRAQKMSLSTAQVEAYKNGETIEIDGSAMDAGFAATDGVIAKMVTAWELPYPPDPAEDGSPREWALPSVDMSMVDELSMADYNKITELVQPVLQAAFPSKPDPTDYDNPQSPTEPASVSDNASRAIL